jgi:hypothetical protein
LSLATPYPDQLFAQPDKNINISRMATDDVRIPQHVGLSEAPRDVEAIKKQEKAAILPHWDSGIAFKLGYNLRTRLLTFERPAVVDISTISTPGHVLFHAVSTVIHTIAFQRQWFGEMPC